MLKINQKILNKIIVLISLIALTSAFFIEYVLKYQPCNLCLYERIPYAVAIVIILLNYNFNFLQKFFLSLLIIVFLSSFLLSLYHLGIELGFVEESFVCKVKNISELLSKDEILQQLAEKSVSCKDVTFKIFGFSLTTLNMIISFLLTITLIFNKLAYGNK
tara:strand:- start:5402 stop:5884 length:483 start_codon:yes stop_codon:yes gene_type:complete